MQISNASVQAAKFAEAVDDLKRRMDHQSRRGQPMTERAVEIWVSFYWPLSCREEGWMERVIAKAREGIIAR